MKILMWICIALATFNFVFVLVEGSENRWDKATFHLVLGIWMWYIVTII